MVLKKKKTKQKQCFMRRLTRTEMQYFLGNCMGSEFVWGVGSRERVKREGESVREREGVRE